MLLPILVAGSTSWAAASPTPKGKIKENAGVVAVSRYVSLRILPVAERSGRPEGANWNDRSTICGTASIVLVSSRGGGKTLVEARSPFDYPGFV